MNRPIAVTLLVALAGLAGLIKVLDVLRFLGILPIAQLGQVEFFGNSLLGAILAGILAAIWFWVAWQLWNLDARGWMFVIVIAMLHLLFDFMAILGNSTFQAMLPSIAITVLALVLAALPKTQEAFGQY